MGLWTEVSLTWLSCSWCTASVTFAALAAFILYYYQSTNKTTWSQYGVKCPDLPKLYFVAGDFRRKISDLLNQHGDTVGIATGSRLALITSNMHLIKNILIKDFSNFTNRSGQFLTSTPLDRSLFFAKGDDWRRQRQIVSPVFTSGKLRYISKYVEKSANDLGSHVENFAKRSEIVPIKDVCGQYACEVIAKTVFGFDVHCIGKEEEFYDRAKNLLYVAHRTISRFLRLIPFLPQFCSKVLKMQLFDRVNLNSHRYFQTILQSTLADRRAQHRHGVKLQQPDYIDLLLKANEAAALGKVYGDDEDLEPAPVNCSAKLLKPLTDDEILGHSMLIIFAGFETTASTLQMCLYELALNPDIQDKVHAEIQRTIKSEAPSYEQLNSLSYTEQVINETLRMYAPLPSFNRVANESITYGDITIPKGATVMIPLFHILMNPSIYPEPEKFDPDRFSSENKKIRNPLSFMPFGQGPRLCLGMRLAYLELKQGLVCILRKMRVVLNESTEPKKGEGKIKVIANETLTPERPIKLAFELRVQE